VFELERLTGLTSADRELIAISSYQDWRQSADREIRAVWTSFPADTAGAEARCRASCHERDETGESSAASLPWGGSLGGRYNEKMMKKPGEQSLKDIATTHMTAEEARDYWLVDQIFSKEMRTGQSALT
jgi:hypothetical protein